MLSCKQDYIWCKLFKNFCSWLIQTSMYFILKRRSLLLHAAHGSYFFIPTHVTKLSWMMNVGSLLQRGTECTRIAIFLFWKTNSCHRRRSNFHLEAELNRVSFVMHVSSMAHQAWVHPWDLRAEMQMRLCRLLNLQQILHSVLSNFLPPL